MDTSTDLASDTSSDVQLLHKMGYAQELERRMGRFSNFAVSFSIICILSGGINSLAQGISGAGGAAIGIGWPIGCAISAVFAIAMAQIASAYPTAGGLYHWGSILGNRGLGWLTAWLNLIGLVTVLGAINVGTWEFFLGVFGPALGLSGRLIEQMAFVIVITAAQALINHRGIRLTSILTDFSGYLILFGSIAIIIAFFAFAPAHPFSRLWTFHNYSGGIGGDVWPRTENIFSVFLLGMLLPLYTMTGYDASAHTSEETKGASLSVPKSIVRSVFWSAFIGWLLLSAIVLAIPDMDQAAAQGASVFFWTADHILPTGIKNAAYVVILLSQFLCGLATVTSVSRMIFAFARDRGLPGSVFLKTVSPRFRTPVASIWTGSILAVLFTAYTPLYTTIVSVTVIFLFLSYAVPIACGLFHYRRGWSKMGPWDIGGWFPVSAVLAIAGAVFIFCIGVQPPNDAALWITLAFLILTTIVWFAVERQRFRGPPIGDEIARRQSEIHTAEQLIGEAH